MVHMSHFALCARPIIAHLGPKGVKHATNGTTNLVEESSSSNWNKPLAAGGLNKPVFVALGKFDGMHQGHRLLAQQAASSGASPYLLSFSGMAEVLGWPARLPLVAACDRARVLASWTPYCQGNTPRQRYIPFAMVRNLSPEQFVQTLVEDMQVSGIVVGQNYRFGYKAAGDSKLLQALGLSHNIKVDIVNLLAAGKGGVEGQVSSSKVRNALNCGQMQQVAESLGRPYRLVAEVTQEAVQLDPVQSHLRIPLRSLLNQPPMYDQAYQVTISAADAFMADSSLKASQDGEVFISDQGVKLCNSLSQWAQHALTDKHAFWLWTFIDECII